MSPSTQGAPSRVSPLKLTGALVPGLPNLLAGGESLLCTVQSWVFHACFQGPELSDHQAQEHELDPCG